MLNKAKERNLNQLAQFRDHLYKKPELAHLFFELTDACNMSCLHCGSNASPQKSCYLGYDGVKKVLESVAKRYDPQKIMVCLTGGEPMLHPDFYAIAALVTKLGFMCGITTNATMIDSKAAERIRESGICSVAISLDGTKENHDWFRNRPGAYEKTLRGIEHLMRVAGRKTTVQVTTVVHKKNIHELDAVYETVLQSKVDSWRLINLEPIGRAQEHQELLLDAKDFRYLLDYIREKRFSPRVPVHVTYGCSHYLGEQYENETRDFYFMCGSGITVGSVLCDGGIYSCLDIERRPELVQGNIQKDDFVEVWENRFEPFRRDKTALCAECRGCAEKTFCKGDSAHTWDYDNNKPMLCYKKIIEGASKEGLLC